MHKHYNGAKTALLMGSMVGLLLVIGALISAGTRNSAFIWIFGLISLGTIAYSYWNSDKIAIRSMNAVPVSEAQAPEYYAVVRQLSQAAGEPMPRLFIAPTMSPNAFATGRNPQHAAVCVTQGLLALLDKRELRGVLGHELMHVYNRDILTGSIAAAIASVVTSVGQMLLFFGGGDRRNANPIASILIGLLAPLAAGLIQMGISRTREYDADEDGARLTQDPLALASALRKLEQGTNAAPLPPDQRLVNTSHMMIANPFGLRVKNMFATHPPMAERIKRLEGMASQGPGA